MPKFREWAETVVGIDINNVVEAQREIPVDPPIENIAFVEDIKGKVD